MMLCTTMTCPPLCPTRNVTDLMLLRLPGGLKAKPLKTETAGLLGLGVSVRGRGPVNLLSALLPMLGFNLETFVKLKLVRTGGLFNIWLLGLVSQGSVMALRPDQNGANWKRP